MLTIKEAKKIPFEQLDEETKEFLYDLFKRYVVRKKIADTNKTLTSIFSKRVGLNPREYARCFNEFNSCFVSTDLIKCLSYDEIHTSFLRKMTEDQFNYFLERTGNSFDRKIALMCFSGRPSERIANRVSFPVMLAYANMQDIVVDALSKDPKASYSRTFSDAARKVRTDFFKATGKRINDTVIASEKTDYKAVGKKCALIWKQMLEFYKKGLENLEPLEAAAFVRENFVFTTNGIGQFDEVIDKALLEAMKEVESDRQFHSEFMEENPDDYISADVDELYSKKYVEDVYFAKLKPSLDAVFDRHLLDPIYFEAEAKKKIQ